MARAKKTPEKNKPVFFTSSLAFTKEDAELLEQFSSDASDFLGRTVSGSAVMRALLRVAAQQPSAWASTTLFPVIEQEIAGGSVWGYKKK